MAKPKIRFKGYTDDWEQRKLSELLYLSSERNDGSYTRDDVLAASLGTELQKKHIYFGLRATDESVKNYKVVLPNDVIYTKSPIKGFPNGIIRTSKGENGIVPTLYCVYHSVDVINPSIIQAYFESKERLDAYLVPLVNIGARNNVNITDKEFLDGSLCIPKDKAEQDKIVNVLERLSNLITLHQRKCEETKKLKKYMLQKMFPQNGQTVPEIRFSGFTDAWEQRKLEDLVDRVTRKNQDLVSELPLTISAQYGLIDQNEFFDKRVASKDVSGYYLIENGEFAYNKSTSTDAPWGAVKRLDRYENGVLSTLYIIFGIKEDNPVDSDFLVSYYSTNLWHKGIHEIAAEGARNHGLLNIAPADFFGTELTIPQDIEEQKKIGKYFEELETLITLHQCKCHLLLKLLHNDWEQRKFGDLGSVAMCKRIFKEQTSTDGDIPFYKIGTFGAEPDAFISRELFEEYREKFQYPNIGDMLISASGTIGRTVEYKGEEAYFQDSNIVWFKHDDRVDNSFLKCIYEIVKWSGIEGSTIKRLYNDNFLKTEFSIPKITEQQQIGMYFQCLDHLITLHHRKYTSTLKSP